MRGIPLNHNAERLTKIRKDRKHDALEIDNKRNQTNNEKLSARYTGFIIGTKASADERRKKPPASATEITAVAVEQEIGE